MAAPAVDEKTLCQFLDRKEFRGSPLRSAWTLVQTLGLQVAWWVLAAQYGPSAGPLSYAALGLAWGLTVLRSYMIFHDCGHGSFFQGFPGAKAVNWATLHLSATMCGTPTDWNVGHALHHLNIGNLGQDDYDWGETIFHTAAQYVKLPPAQQAMWKFLHHPLPFFVLAPALTWYFKMRLPFELRPGRKAAYRFSDKAISTLAMFLRYKLAHHLSILPLVVGGDYLAMFVGVLLFHWQHVYTQGYVRPAETWKLREAAMHGSSYATIPAPLKYFTLGIEYHHIHHFRTRVPGYMLRKVHEAAPEGMWHGVVYLGVKDMWRSLFLQAYDEKLKTYVTFDEVIAAYGSGKAA
jgi:omega-6 fatty acid desaturase (delta-12 desaturase)